MKRTISVLITVLVFCQAGFAQSLPRLGKDPVSRMISAMTPEEKASLVVGAGMRLPGAPPQVSETLQQMSPVVGQTVGKPFPMPYLWHGRQARRQATQ